MSNQGEFLDTNVSGVIRTSALPTISANNRGKIFYLTQDTQEYSKGFYKIKEYALEYGALSASSDQVLHYIGKWDASLNIPDISTLGQSGNFLIVSASGEYELNEDPVILAKGDYVIHNGTEWEVIESMPTVNSVAGLFGDVSAIQIKYAIGKLLSSNIPDQMWTSLSSDNPSDLTMSYNASGELIETIDTVYGMERTQSLSYTSGELNSVITEIEDIDFVRTETLVYTSGELTGIQVT